MIAAKNRYGAMIEKGTWNAPTAEEKIVALEAKLTSSMKSLNKKVTFEMSKNKTGKKQANNAKGGSTKTNKGGTKSDHPKTWPPPKPGDKKEAEYKGYSWYWCGKDTGENANVGAPTTQRNVKVEPLSVERKSLRERGIVQQAFRIRRRRSRTESD